MEYSCIENNVACTSTLVYRIKVQARSLTLIKNSQISPLHNHCFTVLLMPTHLFGTI
jgi:hypothetical protein